MRRVLAFCFTALVPVIILNGCMKKIPPESSSSDQAAESGPPAQSEPAGNGDHAPDLNTPDGAAKKLLDDISNLDDVKIDALNSEYFADQPIPEEYYGILKPISNRMSYKIGNYEIDGDKAAIAVSVTAIDAQSALSTVIPGALAHLAVMQVAGKDVSNPEKILVNYAAKNVEWDKMPTTKTNATLYLEKDANGEWKADISDPGNIDFANAVTGGAIDVAQNLKYLAEKYK